MATEPSFKFLFGHFCASKKMLRFGNCFSSTCISIDVFLTIYKFILNYIKRG